MNPIAYVKSPFLFKNGTPRQPTVCQQARGFITIEKSVFNNPEHSLEGLEDFTHVWIVFVFHQNNNSYTKAKVKPPRLNGRRVGLFSTRSPYRPNNIGLTLAKIESISGATVAVSGIDMIDGTPVLDIKPYIPQYDCPAYVSTKNVIVTNTDEHTDTVDDFEDVSMNVDASLDNSVDTRCIDYFDDCKLDKSDDSEIYNVKQDSNGADIKVDLQSGFAIGFDTDCPASIVTHHESREEHFEDIKTSEKEKNLLSLQHNQGSGSLTEVGSNAVPVLSTSSKSSLSSSNTVGELHRTAGYIKNTDTLDKLNEETSNFASKTAPWIDKPPIQTLDVCFTVRALQQLEKFTFDTEENSPYKLQFMKNSVEAKAAISDILREDPRSTYRRKHCEDSLYYFTVDVIHVTCWFDDCFAEVVRVKAASLVDQCKHKFQ